MNNTSNKSVRPNTNKLVTNISKRQHDKELLLMTHIVIGYPSFDDSLRLVEAMVE